MRILKYLLFFSFIVGFFLIMYRQSDEKGFRKWRNSLQIAIIISATAAGLIPVNPEPKELPGNDNQVYHEKLVSKHES